MSAWPLAALARVRARALDDAREALAAAWGLEAARRAALDRSRTEVSAIERDAARCVGAMAEAGGAGALQIVALRAAALRSRIVIAAERIQADAAALAEAEGGVVRARALVVRARREVEVVERRRDAWVTELRKVRERAEEAAQDDRCPARAASGIGTGA